MPVLASLGLSWRLCVGSGLCVVAPFPTWLWDPGVVPRHPLCVPSPLFLFVALLGCCSPGALPGPTRAVVGVWWGWVGWGGGGVLDAGSGPFPWCLLLGGPMLALPLRVYLCCTGPPFVPARSQGFLAGQACLLPAPMDGVPYQQPLAGPEQQYVPWYVLLVRPIRHPPRPVPPRAADQRSQAYLTLLRVLSWGGYGHRGGPQTPEVG